MSAPDEPQRPVHRVQHPMPPLSPAASGLAALYGEQHLRTQSGHRADTERTQSEHRADLGIIVSYAQSGMANSNCGYGADTERTLRAQSAHRADGRRADAERTQSA